MCLPDRQVTRQADPAAHYFKIQLSDFDLFNVTFTRQGDNLTYYDGYGNNQLLRSLFPDATATDLEVGLRQTIEWMAAREQP